MRARKRSPCRSIVRSMRRTSMRSEPTPRIMRALGRSLRAWFSRHRRDRRRPPPDQKVTDVEFDDLGQRGDRLGGGEIEAVAGVNLEAEAARELRAVADALPLGLRRRH